MENKKVKDVMYPIYEYAVVSEDDTIKDAMQTLKVIQKAMPQEAYYHRAVLVKNKDGEIVGKLGYLGFLTALDPQYEFLDEVKKLDRTGVSKEDMGKEMDELGFSDHMLPMVKERASKLPIKEVMAKIEETVDEDSNLFEAMHLMVQSRSLSLLAVKDSQITGIIRLSDLYEEVCEYIIGKDVNSN